MKNIVLLFSLFLMISCAKNDIEDDSPYNEVLFATIGIGTDSYTGGATGTNNREFVINKEAIWKELLLDNGPFPHYAGTTIDFEFFTVIVVIDVVKSSPGYTTTITSIKENNSTIVVSVTNAGAGDPASSISQPYHIVKIAKTTKRVLFEFAEE